jgi:GNAT superfamily N-acetyltransferase
LKPGTAAEGDMSEPTINSGYLPGAIGRISELHGTYYHQNWGFGLFFEAKVATEISQFLQRYDASSDGIWVVVQDGRIEGSIVIDGAKAERDGAHLRWFILSDALQTRGMGRQLMLQALEFCKSREYKKVYLWTFEGLNAARFLYEEAGFQLVRQQSGEQWGRKVNEQCFELTND